MIALHPFSTSREAVLPVWSPSAQSRRQAPDASLTELFVLLHGMIFTNIQLDDFKGVLARFEEKLMIEGEQFVLFRVLYFEAPCISPMKCCVCVYLLRGSLNTGHVANTNS